MAAARRSGPWDFSRGTGLQGDAHLVILRFPDEQGADHQGHDGDADWVPQTVVDIPGSRHHGRRQQRRQHAPEPAVADVKRQ